MASQLDQADTPEAKAPLEGDLNHEQKAAFTALREAFGVISDLSQAQALLSWDENVYLPPKAVRTRGQQLATLAQVIHERLTDPRLMEYVEALRAVDPESEVGAFVREARRSVERAQKVPSDFVAEMSRVRSAALAAWTAARAEADFARFAPHLEKTLELNRRYADFLGFEKHPYDALHDLYEPGGDVETLKRVFAELRDATVALLQEITASGRTLSDAPVRRPFAEADQEAFGRFVVRALGYDFEGGRLDRTVHPFATRIGQGDVRITTRYEPEFLNPALFGAVHEAGHAMYEQGIAERYARTPLEQAVSLGLHESQSRLWENLVGRSLPFWRWAYPKLQKTFPDALAEVSLEAFYAAINRVEPSFIRVEADEVTYNLHVMVRFELELALLEGSLTVRELPGAWNDLYTTYLGVTPPNDAVGCLQDIHWSLGMIGYFPTYTLGNLMSVQLYEAAKAAHPELEAEFEAGRFGTLLGWLRERVHQHGSRFEPAELLRRATGSELSAAPYVSYLNRKFRALYGLGA
jgi:carboxypeptidase Taq